MRLVSGLLLTAIAAPLSAATLPPPPVFPTGTTTGTFYGIAVADPYRALENADVPKVQAWSDAQNDRPAHVPISTSSEWTPPRRGADS